LLPTTPFLLLGAALYIRSSEKLYNWLISNKWLGSYIKNYREGNGIPLKTKIFAIVTLWIAMIYSIIFLVPMLLVKILLILIALAVTIHILSIKTLKIEKDNERKDTILKGKDFFDEN